MRKNIRSLAKRRAGHHCQNCNAEDKANWHGWVNGFIAGYKEKEREINGPNFTPKDLKRARKEMNLSQRAFAMKLGVGEASVKRWETGFKMNKSTAKLIESFLENQFKDNTTKNEGRG